MENQFLHYCYAFVIATRYLSLKISVYREFIYTEKRRRRRQLRRRKIEKMCKAYNNIVHKTI